MQAFRTLKSIGNAFADDMDIDRVLAFENYAKSMARNQAVIAMSRAMSLEGIVRAIATIHSMIGAPKKKTETKEEKPLEALASWLNGEDVEGFPEVIETPPPPEEAPAVESPAEDDVEEPEPDGVGSEGTPVPEPIT